MRTAFLTTVLLSLSAVPALANGPCAQLLAGNDAIEHQAGFTVTELPDGCVVENGRLRLNGFTGWAFDHAEITGDGLPGLLPGAADWPGRLPSWGRFSADGVRFSAQTNNAFSNYIMSIQQWPMDMSAAFHYDAKEGLLDIQEMQITNLRLGKAALSAQLTLPKDTDAGHLVASGSAGLTHLRLRLDNMGMFEGLAIPALAAALQEATGTDDPAKSLKQFQVAAAVALGALPDSRIDADSRTALSRFVQDLPHPSGFFTLDITFAKPLQIGENMTQPTQLAQLVLADAKIKARYEAR